jgi:hypothetical protein
MQCGKSQESRSPRQPTGVIERPYKCLLEKQVLVDVTGFEKQYKD